MAKGRSLFLRVSTEHLRVLGLRLEAFTNSELEFRL
jgi:hypothetical protein